MGEIVGVSNRPLREALTILRSMGIVKSRPGKGWYVGKFDPAHSLKFISPLLENIDGIDLEQIIDSRLAIEPVIARYAAMNITEAGLVRLQEVFELMVEYANDDLLNEFRKKDREFHEVLTQECHNPIMSTINSILTGLFQTVLYMLKSGNYEANLEQHQMILDGIRARDKDRAEKAMVDHIEKARVFLRAGLGMSR